MYTVIRAGFAIHVTTARKTFALANDMVNISPQDEIYVFNAGDKNRLHANYVEVKSV
jgi:hypothetical protein